MQVLTIALAALSTSIGFSSGAKHHHFSMRGWYVEGCACAAPCTCEMTGPVMGCEGVGAFDFSSGTVDGRSLAGVRAAYATKPGQWVVIYLDAPSASKRRAAETLMRGALADFGKIEAVKDAHITMRHSGNNDVATIDGGKVMDLKTTAMLGGDGKTPLVYGNVHDLLHPTVMGGKTLSCSYSDGGHLFELKDSNAFFHHRIVSSGSF